MSTHDDTNPNCQCTRCRAIVRLDNIKAKLATNLQVKTQEAQRIREMQADIVARYQDIVRGNTH
jgi:hypothetical protein